VVAVRRRSAALNAPSYTLSDVQTMSAANNEPQWLLECREAAWEVYEDLPMPSLKDEEWRRTD